VSITPYSESLGPFWVGDAPTRPAVVEFLDESGELTQRPEGVLTARIVDPQSAPTPIALAVTADPDTEVIEIAWDGFAAFDVAGVWTIIFYEDGARVATLRLAVQGDDGWLSFEDARTDWADAPESDALLYRILDSAKVAVISYTPPRVLAEIAAGLPVPSNLVQAQLMQARATLQATRAGASDTIGADGQTVRVYPLDWNVKAQIRPKRAKPVIR
jgi:hypothetical protein